MHVVQGSSLSNGPDAADRHTVDQIYKDGNGPSFGTLFLVDWLYRVSRKKRVDPSAAKPYGLGYPCGISSVQVECASL